MKIQDIRGTIGVNLMTIDRALAVLQKLPPKEVLTTAELASKLGIGYNTFKSSHSSHPSLSNYRVSYRPLGKGYNQTIWGNQNTIADLRKRFEA